MFARTPARLGRILSLLVIFLISFISCPGSTFAQAGSTAVLSSPDITDFPYLTSYLDLHDPEGGFIHGLTPQQVTILEDTATIPVADLAELTPGVQLVMAVSPGESFLIRDGEGISRYSYFLRSFLSSAWASQPAGTDDYSLLTSGGPQLAHSADPSGVTSRLTTYQPGSEDIVPGLELLSSALQVASDPTTHTGMERAILYITSPQDTDVSVGLQSIIASANQQNIHIFVWVLAAADAMESASVVQLRGLADQTGGGFFGFSLDETLPDLDALLDPLRYIYKLGYSSQINTPGSHQMSAQVALGAETITSAAQSFEVDLKPPAITLLALPREIARSYAAQSTPGVADVAGGFVPASQVVSIRVDYPDGYDHATVSTRLFVDDTLVAQNTAEPFTEFVWDLRAYNQDGEHRLFVEATDNLGMLGKSSESTVAISVPSSTQGMMVAVTQKQPVMIAAIAVVSASILVLALILGGHIRPKPHPGQRRTPPKHEKNIRVLGNPDSNPLSVKPTLPPVPSSQPLPAPEGPIWSRWLARLPWRKQKLQPTPAIAYISPLAGYDEPTIPARLEIIDGDISLGSDPHKASVVLNDPSIEGLHAMINHEGKIFTITDNHTVPGTWVNYVPSSPQGTILQHMDIIHLGRVGFRFQLAEPGPLRAIVVTPLEPPQ